MTCAAPSPGPGESLIEMSGVSVGSLQDLAATVLKDVNWTVAAGEFWVVAGMHRSGKSDFMYMTAGLMPPQGGSFRLFGHGMPIFEEALLPERLRLGLVFDGGQLLRNLTVAENIALPLRYHRNLSRQEAADRVTAMLELTGLAPWADRAPGTLGRSLQQRAGLARALILQPEVLLLDNPLSTLDVRHQHWWLNFLGQLSAGHSFMQGRRVTLVLTADDLRPWKNRASHFAVLQSTRFITLGQRAVLSDSSEPLVRELLAEGIRES